MKLDPMAARAHGLDVAKLTAAWSAWFWAFDWHALGGFLSCVLTALFIVDKLGFLGPVKRWMRAAWRALFPKRERP